MPVTLEDVNPLDVQEAGNKFALGISNGAAGMEYAAMLYGFAKIVAIMARRPEAGTVGELVEIIRQVAQATYDLAEEHYE